MSSNSVMPMTEFAIKGVNVILLMDYLFCSNKL